ncbi:MAG: bifunctional 5,10-methylenetetrahydrofolate dehydrogenase/5,10-methenyltetrahydrofolate cyclohydrolase [Candidatus Tectomicrobia bacterium]|nr:bifunctional 5,10-methylenetetrahydrofolate dehydrogenase/5,10-methenyltetrahydrofolate cyclohydrolase [Candidatus Tectomicrobia bacterium]
MGITDRERIAEQLKGEARKELVAWKQKRGYTPHFTFMIFQHDDANRAMVEQQQEVCHQIEIDSSLFLLDRETASIEVLELIGKLNNEPQGNGLILQIPLTLVSYLDWIFAILDPEKDLAGLHPMNIGRLMSDDSALVPLLPGAIVEILEKRGVTLRGARAVIASADQLFAKAVAMLLLHKQATVTVCQSVSLTLQKMTLEADLLISALGVPLWLHGDMVKDGALLFDLGSFFFDGSQEAEFDLSSLRKPVTVIERERDLEPVLETIFLRNAIKVWKNDA